MLPKLGGLTNQWIRLAYSMRLEGPSTIYIVFYPTITKKQHEAMLTSDKARCAIFYSINSSTYLKY